LLLLHFFFLFLDSCQLSASARLSTAMAKKHLTYVYQRKYCRSDQFISEKVKLTVAADKKNDKIRTS